MPIVLEEVIDSMNWIPFGIKRENNNNKQQRPPPYCHRTMTMTIVMLIVTIMVAKTMTCVPNATRHKKRPQEPIDTPTQNPLWPFNMKVLST